MLPPSTGAPPSQHGCDADTGVFNGTPPAGAAGHLDIVVTASDGLAFATAGFRLDVRRLNHAPIAAADLIVVEEGLPLTIAGCKPDR